jgi:hypothetical protein
MTERATPTKRDIMSYNIPKFLILAVIIGFLVIIGMNIAGSFGLLPAKYISPNDVKNVAVEHGGKMYTLNFEQQKKVIDILNRLVLVSPEEAKRINHTMPVEVTKIVIYKFKGDDVEVKPVGYLGVDSKNPVERMVTMVFSIPQWNKSSLLEESFPNEMLNILSTSYDK